MVVIADIADMGRVLVDGLGHFPRTLYPLKRLTLTKMKLPVLRGARTSTIQKAAKTFNLEEKWSKNGAQQKMDRFNKRRETTDFDRFKIMINRKQRRHCNNKKK